MSAPFAEPAPNDKGAEMALLAGLLLEPERMIKVAEIVRPDDFYFSAHRRLFRAMLGLHLEGKPTDPLLVRSTLVAKDELVEVGGDEGIRSILGCAVDGKNLDHYAGLIRDAAYKRELLNFSLDLQQSARNGVAPEDASRAAIERLADLRGAFSHTESNPFEEITIGPTDSTAWITRGLFARGCITVVHGLPKAGKTTFVYGAQASIHRGESTFVGLANADPCDCIVLTEEPKSVIAETYRTLGVNPARAHTLARENAFPRKSLGQVVDDSVRAIERNPKIGVVILDTWRFWANLADKLENDAGATNRAFDHVRRIAAKGVAVVIIHHSRKSGGEDGTALAGSGALAGSADVIVEVRRFGKGESSSLRHVEISGRLQRLPDPIVIDYQDGRYEEMGDASRAKDKLRDNRVRVCLTHCARWLTWEEVADATGLKRTACFEALQGLHKRGEIRRRGTGKKGSTFLYASLDVPLHSDESGNVGGDPTGVAS